MYTVYLYQMTILKVDSIFIILHQTFQLQRPTYFSIFQTFLRYHFLFQGPSAALFFHW